MVQQHFPPKLQGQPSARDQLDQKEEEKDQQEVNYLDLYPGFSYVVNFSS